jgi:hypothetical protein
MHCLLSTGDTAGMYSKCTVVEIWILAISNMIEFILDMCVTVHHHCR